jgi:hypothetical protein
MHDDVRPVLRDQGGCIRQRPQVQALPRDLPAADRLPLRDPALHARDRDQALRAAQHIPPAPDEAVGSNDIVAFHRKMQRCWPAKVSVRTKHDDSHQFKLSRDSRALWVLTKP